MTGHQWVCFWSPFPFIQQNNFVPRNSLWRDTIWSSFITWVHCCYDSFLSPLIFFSFFFFASWLKLRCGLWIHFPAMITGISVHLIIEFQTIFCMKDRPIYMKYALHFSPSLMMIIFVTMKYPCGASASVAGGDGYIGSNEDIWLQPKANKRIFTSAKEKEFLVICHGHFYHFHGLLFTPTESWKISHSGWSISFLVYLNFEPTQ